MCVCVGGEPSSSPEVPDRVLVLIKRHINYILQHCCDSRRCAATERRYIIPASLQLPKASGQTFRKYHPGLPFLATEQMSDFLPSHEIAGMCVEFPYGTINFFFYTPSALVIAFHPVLVPLCRSSNSVLIFSGFFLVAAVTHLVKLFLLHKMFFILYYFFRNSTTLG